MTKLEILALMTLGAVLQITWWSANTDVKINQMEKRVTSAEKTLVTLHTCFPGGHYKPDAAPTCPAFKDWMTGELNKSEEK